MSFIINVGKLIYYKLKLPLLKVIDNVDDSLHYLETTHYIKEDIDNGGDIDLYNDYADMCEYETSYNEYNNKKKVNEVL